MEIDHSQVDMALKYGPFFFSLFLLIVGSTKTRRDLKQAIKELSIAHGKPGNVPDSPVIQTASQQVADARKFHFITFISGMVLVFASVLWWFYSQPANYIFRVQLVNIYDYHKTSSTDFYIKKQIHEMYKGEESHVRNESLIIVQKRPFNPNSKFSLKLSKGGRKIYIFDIPYTDKGVPRYELIEQGEKIGLKLKEIMPVSRNWSVNLAWAKEIVVDAEDVVLTPRVETKEPVAAIDPTIVTIPKLQNELTTVGDKIDIIDAIMQTDKKKFEEIMSINFNKEFIVTTLLDLTRHSDKELASKARKLFSLKGKDYNVGKEFAKSYKKGKINKDDMVEIVTRASQEQAISIMNNFAANTNANWAKDLKNKVIDGEIKHLALVPTGSAGGDKYYVKATWNPKDEAVVRCLTVLFNESLISRRSLADEKVLMKERSERYVYWYSKEWAISMYNHIKKCGGDATFVAWR